ncbi:MAG: hypothetical protein EXQ47_01615 [Bryobacterales bacterium]|nr:hypothetical protein [Bryobacterales bacterium]
MDKVGHPHSEALRVIERFRRPSFGRLTVEVTIDDPKAYTKPWTATLPFNLQLNTDLMESICENEKDAAHIAAQ